MKKYSCMRVLMCALLLFGVLCGSAWADIVYTSKGNFNKIWTQGAAADKDSFNIVDGADVTSKLQKTTTDVLPFYLPYDGKSLLAVRAAYSTSQLKDDLFIYNVTAKTDEESVVDWADPVYSGQIDLENIHDMCYDGRYIYASTYEKVGDNKAPGVVAKIDVSGECKIVATYSLKSVTQSPNTYVQHGESIAVVGDYVYVNVYQYDGTTKALPSEIHRLKKSDLSFVDSATVGTGACGAGMGNGGAMAYHDGKLYVAAFGADTLGAATPGAYLGDLYAVDVETMAATKLLDSSAATVDNDDEDDTEEVGYFSIRIADDGTAFILCGNTTDDKDYLKLKVFKTTVAKLANNEIGDEIVAQNEYDVLMTVPSMTLDSASGVLWVLGSLDAESSLHAYKLDGTEITTFVQDDVDEFMDDTPPYSLTALTIPAPIPQPEQNANITTPDAAQDDTSDYKADVVAAAADGVKDIPTEDLQTTLDTLIKEGSSIALASFDVRSGKAVFDRSVAMSMISNDTTLVDPDFEDMGSVVVVPTFLGTLAEEGKTLVVGIEVSGDKLCATSGSDIKLAKIRNDGRAYQLEQVAKKSDLEDGKFTVLNQKTKKYVGDNEAIVASDSYLINLAIKDGGPNDLTGEANKFVLDPVAFYSVTEKAPVDPEHSSSSGACTGGAAALVGLAALALLKRKR